MDKRIQTRANKVLIIPDLHMPFHDKKSLSEVVKFAKSFRPDCVVQIGDLYDCYSFSRFSRNPDLITPKDELLAAKGYAVEMWASMKKASPRASLYQLRGNHESRLIKRMMDKVPEFESLLEAPITSLFKYRGVVSLPSERSELVIGDIILVHGWSLKPEFHMNYFGMSCVHGHSHRAGIVYKPHRGKALFEMNVGHLADEGQIPLCYGSTMTSQWTKGFGIISKGEPRFIRL